MDRKTILLVAATLFVLGLALIFVAAVKGQEPVTYAPVVQPGYYVQQPAVWIPPRPGGVYVRYRRPTFVGQFLFGDFLVWTPIYQAQTTTAPQSNQQDQPK